MVEFVPAVHAVRQGEREEAARREAVGGRGLRKFVFQRGEGKVEGRTAGGVEAFKFLGLCVPGDGEGGAADAAGFEEVEADLRGEGQAGADHAVLTADRGARGEGAAVDAVGLGEGGRGAEK